MTENQVKLSTIMKRVYNEAKESKKTSLTFTDYTKDLRKRLKQLSEAIGIDLHPMLDSETKSYVVEKSDEEFWFYVMQNLTKPIFQKRRLLKNEDPLTYDEIIEEGEIIESIIRKSGKSEEQQKESLEKLRYLTGYTLIRKMKGANQQLKQLIDDACNDVLGKAKYTTSTIKPKSNIIIDPDDENFDLNKLMEGEDSETTLHYYDAEELLDFYVTLLIKSTDFFHSLIEMVSTLRADDELELSKASTPEEMLAKATRVLQQKHGITLL